MTKPEREYSSVLWLISFKMPSKMRFLLANLPQPNSDKTINDWLYFSYALTEAPHTTKQLWKVTRFIAGIRTINDAIKVSNDTDNSTIGSYTLDQLVNAVPVVTVTPIMLPKRYNATQQAGRKNIRKRVKAHYQAEYSRCMGLRVKRLHYEGLFTIHTVYAAALYLEEFVTARLNEYTNQPNKPDHKRALSAAVAFYHGAKKAAERDQWPVKLPAYKRAEVDRQNLIHANKVLKQKRIIVTRESIKAIKGAMAECIKPNGKHDIPAIMDKTGLSKPTVYKYLQAIADGAK